VASTLISSPSDWTDAEADLDQCRYATFDVIDTPRDDWSGLYDAAGRKLYRAREPFGFRLTRD